jgi:hypothetical protein
VTLYCRREKFCNFDLLEQTLFLWGLFVQRNTVLQNRVGKLCLQARLVIQSSSIDVITKLVLYIDDFATILGQLLANRISILWVLKYHQDDTLMLMYVVCPAPNGAYSRRRGYNT